MYKRRGGQMFILLVLKFFVIITLVIGSNDSSFNFSIPKDWDTLCPYTDICHQNAARNIKLPDSMKPCCDSCSCDEDCGLYRNCCQYSMDKYRIDEMYETHCTSLTVYKKDSALYENHKYNIVDRCPNKTSCYNFNAANWGSMYPVSTKVTNIVFLNEFCALCHGISNVLKWETEINCVSNDSQAVFVSEALEKYLDGILESGICGLRFLPPTDFIPKCGFRFPMIRNCKWPETVDKETEKQCTNYNATFYYLRAEFANIHCFLCSSSVKIQHVCGVSDSNRLRANASTFTFLLSPREITGLKTGDQNECQSGCNCKEPGIVERHSGLCRQIRCPVAMLPRDGKCSYLTDTWTAGPFSSFLRLQPVSQKDVVDLNKTDINTLKDRNLFRYMMKSWKKQYFISVDSNKVSFFIIRVTYKRQRVNIKDFINNFRASLNTIWTLKINNTEYRMTAHLHRFYEYIFCNNSGSILFLARDRGNHKTECSLLAEIDEENLIRLSEFFQEEVEWYTSLTKFFFCNQVDLKPHEYEIRESQLYFKVTKQIFEKLEYRKLMSRGQEIISLCTSDFGEDFWMSSNSNPNSAFRFIWMYCLLVMVTF